MKKSPAERVKREGVGRGSTTTGDNCQFAKRRICQAEEWAGKGKVL